MINRIAELNRGGGRQKLLPNYSDPHAPGYPTEPGEPWSQKLSAQLESYIGEHPVISLTVGLTLGIVVGCLIKRR